MKRVLSLIMVLALVLSMVPAVFAADTAVVSSGTATADADSKWTYMYTPAVDGALTVTVGDGNAAWASDIMDFSDYSDIEDVTGTAEGSYTHAVTGGVTYCVRIFGQGDPSAAVSNIPYSISFAASETEDLGEAIKTGTASCYEETFTGEGKTWTEFLPEEIKVTAPANGEIVVKLQAPTNVAAATEPMWSCEAVGTKFPNRQATDGTYRFDVYSGQEYTVAIGAYDAYEDESTAPQYISGNVAYEIYFVAGEVELKDYVVSGHVPMDVVTDGAMILRYPDAGANREYTATSVFSGESVTGVNKDYTVAADPTAKVTIFAFEPAMDANGVYKFTAPEGVKLTYWGTQSALPALQEKDAALADNVIYATVDNGIWNLCKPVINAMGDVSEDETEWYWLWSSSQMLIGVEGASGEVVLNAEKTDALESLEADTSGEDTPNYSIKHGFPTGFYNLADDAVLEAVNLEEDHTAVKGDDGYYHLDTVDGPIVYVDTETSYISLSTLVSAMALNVTYVNDDGEEVKENFGSAMRTYADKLTATDGVYPLTRDLEIFLSHYGWQTDLEALPYDDETADANTALMSVCRIVAGSAGEEEKNELAIGQNEIAVPADGVTYTYKVIADGNMNITVEECDAASYEYVVSVNGEELVFADDAGVYEGALPVAVKVDDEIAVAVYTYDADGNEAAGNVTLKLAYVIPSSTEEIVFQFGENVAVTDDATDHVDGSKTSPIEETVGEYTLSLTDTGETQLYYGAIDEMGNSCIKLGKSSGVGGFTFTVPEEVTSVVFAVAGYKAKTVTVSVNGVNHAISTTSNNGAYTDITVDTSVTKAITFKTTSTGYRAMIDSITYVITTGGCEHVANGEGVVTAPTCTADGYTTYTCVICGEEYTGNPVASTGHDHKEEVTTAATCTTDGVKTFTCACGDSYTETIYAAHDYVDGACSVCGAKEYVLVTAPEAGVAYKWGLNQANLGRDLYFIGDMDGYYGATSHIIENAIDVVLEETEGGYYISFTNADGAKKYINIVASGTYINFKIEDAASSVYTYNEEYNTMVTDLSGTEYFIGTYNTFDTFSASKSTYLASGNFPSHFYAAPAAEEEPTLPSGSITVDYSYDWTAPATGNVTMTADNAIVVEQGMWNPVADPGTVVTFDAVEGTVYTIGDYSGAGVINVAWVYNSVSEGGEGGEGGETEPTYEALPVNTVINVGQTSYGAAGEELYYVYTAEAAGTLNLTLSNAIMGGSASATVTYNGVDQTLTPGAEAPTSWNLAAGESVYVVVNCNTYASLTTAWSGESSGEEPVAGALVLGDNAVEVAAGLTPGSWTYTATEAGTLTVTVSALSVDGEAVDAAYLANQFAMGRIYLTVNGAQVGTNTTTVTVAAGDVVTIGMSHSTGSALAGTINLALTTGSEGGEDEGEGDGSASNPWVIKELPWTLNITGNHDVYYKYTAEPGTYELTYSEGGLIAITGADWEKNEETSTYIIVVTEKTEIIVNPWTMSAEEVEYTYTMAVQGEEEPEQADLSFEYRYGTNNLFQVNTNLPATTPCVDFTASANGCVIDQTGNIYQQVGWIGMNNADGIIVLTFNFNNAFEAGQNYVLPAGAVFGFTDGNTYTLDADYEFVWDGTTWTMNKTVPTPEPDGSVENPFIIESLPFETEITLTAENCEAGLHYKYTVPEGMTQVQIDYVDGVVSYIYGNYDYVVDSNGNSIYPVEPGSTFLIETYSWNACTYTFKVSEWVAPSEPDGSVFAPYIIESLPTTLTVELDGQSDVYYKHTATEAGAIAAESDGAQVGIMVNGDYAYGNPITYAAGDVLTFNVGSWGEGTYEVKLYDPTVAKIGDVAYTDLSDALAYANENATAEAPMTVTLFADVKDEGYLTIDENVTLDLGVYDLYAKSLNVLNGGHLTAAEYSDTADYGKLYVASESRLIMTGAVVDGSALNLIPVWNEADAYVFGAATFNTQYYELATTDTEISFKFVPQFRKALRVDFFEKDAADGELTDNGLKVILRLTWMSGDNMAQQDFVYGHELLEKLACGNTTFTFSLTGYDAMYVDLADLTITPMIVTDSGLIMQGATDTPDVN